MLVPLHLRGAATKAGRQRDYPVAVPPADRRMRAGRCQGRLSLPELLSRALIEAASRGFQNCLMLDMLGNVAEFGKPTCSWRRTGSSTRRRRMVPS